MSGGYVFFGLFALDELLVLVVEELLRVRGVELACAAVHFLRNDARLALVGLLRLEARRLHGVWFVVELGVNVAQ